MSDMDVVEVLRDAIAEKRDEYPRLADDADSGEVAEYALTALCDAGWVVVRAGSVYVPCGRPDVRGAACDRTVGHSGGHSGPLS